MHACADGSLALGPSPAAARSRKKSPSVRPRVPRAPTSRKVRRVGRRKWAGSSCQVTAGECLMRPNSSERGKVQSFRAKSVPGGGAGEGNGRAAAVESAGGGRLNSSVVDEAGESIGKVRRAGT